jgi:hypothetical protein
MVSHSGTGTPFPLAQTSELRLGLEVPHASGEYLPAHELDVSSGRGPRTAERLEEAVRAGARRAGA